jgi:hypothetical protein
MTKSQKPQQRKNKAEVDAELKRKAKNERSRLRALRVFPLIASSASVYDAQTAVNAVAGHIKYGLIQQEAKLMVSDLSFELGKGKSAVDAAVRTILEAIGDDGATEAMETLELMGRSFSSFVEARALKEPMSTVTQGDFIA